MTFGVFYRLHGSLEWRELRRGSEADCETWVREHAVLLHGAEICVAQIGEQLVHDPHARERQHASEVKRLRAIERRKAARAKEKATS